MSDASEPTGDGKPWKKTQSGQSAFRADAVTPDSSGAGCGPDCGHDHLQYEKSGAAETKKAGFIEKIGEELKTTRGKVIAFGAVAVVALGAYMLLNQPEQSQTQAR